MKSAYRLLAGAALILLMGCGSSADMRDKLGLVHEGPDEYRVVPRPPLSVPPEFNLRPPGQASDYVSGVAAQTRAEQQVLGAQAPAAAATSDTAVVPVTSAPLPSSSDSQLLANAGAAKADPQIRQKLLDDKTGGAVSKDPGYLFGGKTESDAQVDAAKEAQRLKDDKAKNQPPTSGETPMVPPESKGILSDIF